MKTILLLLFTINAFGLVIYKKGREVLGEIIKDSLLILFFVFPFIYAVLILLFFVK